MSLTFFLYELQMIKTIIQQKDIYEIIIVHAPAIALFQDYYFLFVFMLDRVNAYTLHIAPFQDN